VSPPVQKAADFRGFDAIAPSWCPALHHLTSGTSDIADAHVVICARRADQPVVTSDPGDLSKLDPALTLVVV